MELEIVDPTIHADVDPFPSELTYSLAQDLVLKTAPYDEIARTYKITSEKLTSLVKTNELLRKTIIGISRELKLSGGDGGFNMRVRAVTEAMLPEAMQIVRDENAKHSDKARIITTFMSYNTNQEKNRITASGAGSAASAVQVVFNVDNRIRGIRSGTGPRPVNNPAPVTINQQ